MAATSGIEWTDATWNPVRGCTRVSDGCRHCYAEQIAARFSGPGQPFHGFAERDRPGSKWTGRVQMVLSALALPISWRKPRRIFVNSMSDLFHEDLPDRHIGTIYGHAIAAARLRGHTLQILTKRALRMRRLLHDPDFWRHANDYASALVLQHGKTGATDRLPEYGPCRAPPGIWLGVSAENQAAADERIPHLLACPAAVRFVSAEPLLGPLDLERIAAGSWGEGSATDSLRGRVHLPGDGPNVPGNSRIGWVITGGESGTGARAAHPDWFRSLRDQCKRAEVPFFFKQWGEWAPADPKNSAAPFPNGWRALRGHDSRPPTRDELYPEAGAAFVARFGKTAAANLLDGQEHQEFPTEGEARC